MNGSQWTLAIVREERGGSRWTKEEVGPKQRALAPVHLAERGCSKNQTIQQ